MLRSFYYALMKNNILQPAIFSLAIALSSPVSHAGGSEKASQGFSGRVQAGIAYVTSTDQLDTDADKRADGLGSNADRYHDMLPLFLFDLRYTFSPSGRQIYFGTPREQQGPPKLTLGTVLPFEDGSALDVSVFGRPFEKVWKDPYLSGERRDDTKKGTYGAKLAYSDILAKPIEISSTLR